MAVQPAMISPQSDAAIADWPVFRPGSRILFQGDSITDGNRGRDADPNHVLGHGYAFLIAAKIGALLPSRGLIFLNRGVSGNTISDLEARWRSDALELRPDVLSILIGVNDALREAPIERFERTYERLIRDALAANPAAKLVLGEPFTLPANPPKSDWSAWRARVQLYQQIAVRLSARFEVPMVPFQAALDAACQRAPADYWVWDTIHPTYAGHQIMAESWLRTVKDLL